MRFSRFMYALSWAIGFSLVAASPAPLDLNVERRSHSPGEDLRRALLAARFDKRETVSNSTTLDKSFDAAVLFSIQPDVSQGHLSESLGTEITCVTCYVTGTATAQFTVDGNFNASQAFDQFIRNFTSEVHNVTGEAINEIGNYVEHEFSDIVSLDLQDLSFPTIPLNFSLDVPPIPECHLTFQFDGLELYMLLDTTLSAGATYTLNLYTSESPIGFAVGSELQLGVIFEIDLILDVDAEIDIRSGFHIQLSDGVALDINMFDPNVGNINFNGGHFEFLPVTINNGSAVFSAVLRLGIHAGLEFQVPDFAVAGHTLGKFSTGAEVGIFANVAEFITNVTTATATASNSSSSSSGCEIVVAEEYRFAVGAEAGATLAVDHDSWGPMPTTTIPIWYTTLGETCATQATQSTTSVAVTAQAERRQDDDRTTTTISTSFTYTAVQCQSSGLVNCPISLQSTLTYPTSTTRVTAVPSGSSATFPATTRNTVLTTIPFGPGAQPMTATSGSPVSYVPRATTGFTKPHGSGISSKDKKIAIGVGVGVGVPVLIAIVAGSFFLWRHVRSKAQPRTEWTPVRQEVQESDSPGTPPGSVTVLAKR